MHIKKERLIIDKISCTLTVGVAQLVADNCSICGVKEVVADSAPVVVHADLHPTLIGVAPVH